MWHWLNIGLGGFLLLGYLKSCIECGVGNRRIRKLKDTLLIDPQAHLHLPRVSILVPARNEGRGIEAALTSLLHLDYPDYELIVINDRSEDDTGSILETLNQAFPQLKVITVDALPAGWLGKNHALFVGAQRATGDLFLFTDADVVFETTALRRAVHLMRTQTLDHLTAFPAVIAKPFALSLLVGTFGIYFSMFTKPWQAANPKSGAFIGIGAFNLIHKSVYEAVGTHQAIAMRPDDDIKLGKLVKKNGFRQNVCNADPLIAVEWYHSLGEMVDGLMKNAFSGLDYSLPFALVVVTLQFLFSVWPVIALFTTDGLAWWLYAGCVLLMQVLCLSQTLRFGQNPLTGLFFPACTLMIIYIVLRATALTLIHNGIHWRGTHYPLSSLRANPV